MLTNFDIFLSGGDGFVRREGSENANAHAFIGEISNERATPAVAASVAQSRQLVKSTEHLDEAIR